jgi:hypothetical protein
MENNQNPYATNQKNQQRQTNASKTKRWDSTKYINRSIVLLVCVCVCVCVCVLSNLRYFYSNVARDIRIYFVFWTEHNLHWTTNCHGDKNQGAVVNFLKISSTGRCFEVSEMPNVNKRDMWGHRNMWIPEQLLGYTWRFSFKWLLSFARREALYEKPLKRGPSPVIIRSVQSSGPSGIGNKARIGNTQKCVDKFSCRNWQ